MAVLVTFFVPGASPDHLQHVEQLTMARGEAVGGPPYPGCMFIAVTPAESGFGFVSAWRTEADFRSVLETMLGPDLATVELAVADVSVAPVVSMAIPGAHG